MYIFKGSLFLASESRHYFPYNKHKVTVIEVTKALNTAQTVTRLEFRIIGADC